MSAIQRQAQSKKIVFFELIILYQSYCTIKSTANSTNYSIDTKVTDQQSVDFLIFLFFLLNYITFCFIKILLPISRLLVKKIHFFWLNAYQSYLDFNLEVCVRVKLKNILKYIKIARSLVEDSLASKKAIILIFFCQLFER